MHDAAPRTGRFFTFVIVLLALALLYGCVLPNQAILKQQQLRVSQIPYKWRSKPTVLLDSLTEVAFQEHSSGNKVKTKEVLWVYINQRNPNDWEDVVFFDHDSFEEPLKIEATVYYPDGSQWTLEQDEVKRDRIDFNNTHWNYFSIPEYDEGILIRLEIRRVYFHPEFISTFVLRHGEPVLNRKILLTYPESCQLNYGLENPENADVEQSTLTEKGHRKVSITATNLPSRRAKWRTEFPEQWYAALHVSFPPKGNRSYSWEQIGDHYLELSEEAFEVSTPIKDFGASIKSKTREEILNEAFQTLVSKVRYHGDWEGRYAFFPRKAETILAHGYGDCKELSTLLHTLLKTKKLESRLSLISTFKHMQPLAQYPSLGTFNHMILASPSADGRFHFLDGTYSLADAGSSYYPLVGRTAFILEPGNSRLVEVDQGDNFKSRVTTNSKIVRDSDSGRWLIEGDIRLQGNPALRFFSYLNNSESTDKTMLARRFVKGRFGILPMHIEFEAPTCDKATITYKASFQSNFLNVGKGGFKLSLPGLYDTAVDKELINKYGPVFLEQFEQLDNWELPNVPNKEQLYRYELPFAALQWQTDGNVVSRTYRQTSRHFEADDDELEVWTNHCTKTGENLVWD